MFRGRQADSDSRSAQPEHSEPDSRVATLSRHSNCAGVCSHRPIAIHDIGGDGNTMLIHQTHVLLHQSGRQRPRRWAICGRRLWGHRPAVPSTRRQYDDGPRRRSGLWPWGRRRGCGMRRRPPLLQKALRRRLTSADCRGSSSRSRSSRSSSRRGAAAGVDETTSQARAPNLLHDRLPPPPRALFGALLEQLGIPREPHLFTDGLLAVRPAVVDLAPLARRQLVEAPARQLPSDGRRGQ